MPLAAMTLGRPVKFTEDRREHFISAAHERAQEHHVEVGFDDDGRLLGLDVEFWHDNGAYTPYGLIVPIITSTQLLGPYKPPNYRVVFESLYTNTVIVTPYRGAGRPQGCFVMERTMDAIAAYLGKDRTEVRCGQLHPARRVPLRPGPDLPGRAGPRCTTPATTPPRWRSSRRWSAGTSSSSSGRRWRPRDDGSASAWRATSRAPASAPTRARTSTSRPPARSRSRPA